MDPDLYDSDSNTVARGSRTVSFSGENLWELDGSSAEQGISFRRRALESLPQFSVADLCEMAIVINSTGYEYDAPQLHAPIARMIEIPEMLLAKKMGSGSPIPYYMAAGNSLKHTVEAGELLTYGMIEHDPKSCLWKLRREQDELFGTL